MIETAAATFPPHPQINVEKFLPQFSSIPPFNSAAVRILGLASFQGARLEEVEELLNSDPSLLSQLLVVANSALFGNRAQVASARRAIELVGLYGVRDIVTTVAASAYMRRFPPEVVKPIWGHAVATGSDCRTFS